MQGELFHGMEKNVRHTEELEDEKPVEAASFFEKFQVTLSFDKIAIVSISMVVVLAVTFAMGVEKGKQKALKLAAVQTANEAQAKTVIQQEWSSKSTDAKQEEQSDNSVTLEASSTENQNSNSVTEAVTESKSSPAVTPQDFSLKKSKGVKAGDKKQAIDEQNKRYTIRLASYIKQTQAKSAAQKLKKKGYDTFVKQSGKYFVLNVGTFSGKQNAQQTLFRIRKELGIGQQGFIRSI